MSAESPDARLKILWEDIRRQMGVCPSFFRLAGPDPAIARGFFDLAKFAYLDNPLPSLFKETLFVSLSRFCNVRYCVTRHTAFLLGRGHIAGDPACSPLTLQTVIDLLNEPFPDREQLPGILASLEGMTGPLTLWPDYDSLVGGALRTACAVIFLEKEGSVKWSAALRRLLGPKQFVQLMLFLTFVRIAHFWTQAHVAADGLIPMASETAASDGGLEMGAIPQLVFEEDIESLLREHQTLTEFLLHNEQDAMKFRMGGNLHAELQELRTIRHLSEALQENTLALQEQLDLNKTITDNAASSLLLIDTSGRVTFVNPATETVTGFKPEELVGRVLHEMLHHTHPDGSPFPIRDCPLNGSFPLPGVLQGYEDMFIHKDGHFYPVRCNARAIVKHGVRCGTVIEIQNITDLQRAQEQRRLFTVELARQVEERTEELVISQKRLRKLATELNLTEQRERQRIATELHDYLSQLLVVSRLKLGQTRQLLEAGSQGLAIITETEDVLDQALKYTRTLVAELSPPVLFEFGLQAALEWLVKQMARHGLTVEMECLDIHGMNLPEDQAILLFQSVRELFLNVLKHADTNHANLTLQKQENMFHIIVRDQGKGFLAEKIPETPSGDHAVKFGLFSIRERMVAMGGILEIQSEPDQGTTANLRIPLQPELDEPVQQQETDGVRNMEQECGKFSEKDTGDSSDPNRPHAIRIVLVDDHVMVREGLRKMLEGHTDLHLVGEAGNGEEALDLVEQLRPSLVIMDVNMPRLNGIEATSRIKARHPDIVVIGLSVNTGGETQKAMLKAGAVALLPKEAAVAELYSLIKEVSRSHGAR